MAYSWKNNTHLQNIQYKLNKNKQLQTRSNARNRSKSTSPPQMYSLYYWLEMSLNGATLSMRVHIADLNSFGVEA